MNQRYRIGATEFTTSGCWMDNYGASSGMDCEVKVVWVVLLAPTWYFVGFAKGGINSEDYIRTLNE